MHIKNKQSARGARKIIEFKITRAIIIVTRRRLINTFLGAGLQYNLLYFSVNIFLLLIYFAKYLSRILNTTYLLTTFYFQHHQLETQEDIMTVV